MEIRQIIGNTYIIETKVITIPFYRLNETEVILLDSGWRKDGEEIRRTLSENGFKVKGILNSHSHPDHLGNNEFFRKTDGATTALSEVEAWIYSSISNLKVFYNILTMQEIEEDFADIIHTPDILIPKDAESISFLGVDFKLYRFPGHSDNQLAIRTPDNVVYLGDLILSEKTLRGSKIPYDFYLKEDLVSKEKVRSLEADRYILAHDGIVENQDELKELSYKNIAFFKNKARQIFELIEENSTMEDIFKKVKESFNLYITTPKRYAVVIRMLRSNVEYLEYRGYLYKVMDDSYVKYRKNVPDWDNY